MQLLPLAVFKDAVGAEVASGPAQSDVHQERIIGAIHPFAPLPSDPRMCKTCGLTRNSHRRSFKKQTGFDTPFHLPAFDSPAPPPNALQVNEEEQNNNQDTTHQWLKPPSPLLVRFMSPNDDSTEFATPDGQTHDPLNPELLDNDEAAELAEQTPPAAFHEPLQTPSSNLSKRAPRGSESGNVGEWQSNRAFNFVSAGQLVTDKNTRPANQDRPIDPMKNTFRQDGPVFGPDNPGLDAQTQIDTASRMASPDVQVPVQDRVHNFTQCPQCGIAVNGTEPKCPNAWCGHDLENDNTASYDHWAITGGMSKSTRNASQ